MQTSGAELSALVGTFFWPFIRIGAMFFAAPILGTRMVPVRVRIIISIGSIKAIFPITSANKSAYRPVI